MQQNSARCHIKDQNTHGVCAVASLRVKIRNNRRSGLWNDWVQFVCWLCYLQWVILRAVWTWASSLQGRFG